MATVMAARPQTNWEELDFRKYRVSVRIESYIAHPYWPEQNELIDIIKRSGMARARSEEKKAHALKTWLEKEGVTMAEYEALQRRAARPWYRQTPDDETSPIVIPRHQLSGALVQATKSAPKGARLPADDLRSRVRLFDFVTDRTTRDTVFARYIKNDLTNQRRYQENEVIENFVATGELRIDANRTDPKAVKDLLRYAFWHIGVGAARKMGMGRGEVIDFAQV